METNLAAHFAQHQPAAIGNEFLVVGTFDRVDWQKGVNAPVAVAEILDYLHDFRQVLNVEVTGGWMPKDMAR